MGVNATRMVFLVDELEKLGLVERRRNPDDRRSHALYLTDQGRAALARSGGHRRARAADERRPDRAQRRELIALLRQVAAAQGLHPGNLPGFPPHQPGR